MAKKVSLEEIEFIAPFKQLRRESVARAGGKGAQLGEMLNAGLPVPNGFVVLTASFDYYTNNAMVDPKTSIDELAYKLISELDVSDVKKINAVSEQIKHAIMKGKMPKEMEQAVLSAYDALKANYVAVRSSATAEDAADASWAGELESYTHITKKNLLETVKKCWASLYTPRAIFYRIEKKLRHEEVAVAVVVQKMVESEVAGVAFTVHPVTNDEKKIVIEAGLGLGESVVSGKITPDNYIVDKDEMFIEDITVSNQQTMIKKVKGESQEIKVPGKDQEKQKLTGQQIIQLAEICKNIEAHYKHPQDIEWAVEGNEFFIVQSRPVTTLKKT
jgi:pyruvate,water dikinase